MRLQDDPLDYLGVLGNDAVNLYAAVRRVRRSNQSIACVDGCDTAIGISAAAILKCLGYSVLAFTHFPEGVERLKQSSLALDWVYCRADILFQQCLAEVSVLLSRRGLVIRAVSASGVEPSH